MIVGIGKIIPGVSGSMLAISMGVYERAAVPLIPGTIEENASNKPITKNIQILEKMLTNQIEHVILPVNYKYGGSKYVWNWKRIFIYPLYSPPFICITWPVT